MRVPVVSVEGKPLMPCKPAKARKLLRNGQAIKRWSKLGTFYIQLTRPVANKVQDMSLAIDLGAKYDGYAIASEKEVQIRGMAVLPRKVAKKMAERRRLRRARRYRNTWRRPKRLDNRQREGWIAPSQLAKVQLRLKIAKELCKLYPIKRTLVEDVRFNHYRNRHGKYFSTAEIGKTKFYDELSELAEVLKYEGWQTAQFRKEYNIPKSSKKDALEPESHANDAVAMLCGFYGHGLELSSPLSYWQRLELSRRSLHRQNYQRGGIRPEFGGTAKGHRLRKGDYVEAQYGSRTIRGWVVGIARAGIGIADEFGKRLCQAAESKVRLLCRSTGITWAHSSPPFRKGTPAPV